MPRISINRRRPKQPDPLPVVVEEKVDDSEQAMDDASDENVAAYMKDLAVEAPPPKSAAPSPAPQYEAPKRPDYRPQQFNPTTYAQKPANVVRNRQRPYRPSHDPRSKFVNRRTASFYTPSRKKKEKAKLQFRSHYGPGGEYLTTQEKAGILLQSCFG